MLADVINYVSLVSVSCRLKREPNIYMTAPQKWWLSPIMKCKAVLLVNASSHASKQSEDLRSCSSVKCIRTAVWPRVDRLNIQVTMNCWVFNLWTGNVLKLIHIITSAWRRRWIIPCRQLNWKEFLSMWNINMPMDELLITLQNVLRNEGLLLIGIEILGL